MAIKKVSKNFYNERDGINVISESSKDDGEFYSFTIYLFDTFKEKYINLKIEKFSIKNVSDASVYSGYYEGMIVYIDNDQTVSRQSLINNATDLGYVTIKLHFDGEEKFYDFYEYRGIGYQSIIESVMLNQENCPEYIKNIEVLNNNRIYKFIFNYNELLANFQNIIQFNISETFFENYFVLAITRHNDKDY